MARRIDLTDDALVVRYSGLSRIAVLAEELRIPYAQIQGVAVGSTALPGTFAWRVGVNAGPFGETRKGRFRVGGAWEFYDVDDRDRTIVLDCDGWRYRRVTLTVDDPETTARKIRAKLA
jgi:hypothetical protein